MTQLQSTSMLYRNPADLPPSKLTQAPNGPDLPPDKLPKRPDRETSIYCHSYVFRRLGSACIHCHLISLAPNEPNPTEAQKWLANQPRDPFHLDRRTKWHYVDAFAYAFLDRHTVDLLRNYTPVLEVGAGRGYWAYEMDKAGIDVVATDPEPPDTRGQLLWHPVKQLNAAEAIATYPDRNLLMCWPYMEDWPAEALRHFTGRYVIYIGEDRSGCTGTDEMFDMLSTRYRPVLAKQIPKFSLNHDRIEIYERLQSPPSRPTRAGGTT